MNAADPAVLTAMLAALAAAIEARDRLIDEGDLIYAPYSDKALWEKTRDVFLKAIRA